MDNKRKGKTYEQIYGKERAKDEREKRKFHMIGDRNPAKREDVKEKIRLNMIEKYKSGKKVVWNKKNLDEELIKKLYLEGKSSKEIGDIMCCSDITILCRLKKMGIKIENKGRFKKGNVPIVTKERYNKVSNSLKRRWLEEDFKNRMIEIIREASNAPEVRKIHKINAKKQWANEFSRSKLLSSQNIKPNKPEKIVINLIKQYNINFNYVGDGKFWITSKDGSFNPDFINEEKKLIIEVFGDYWHNKDKKIVDRDRRRLKAYNNNGYKTLIIWEHELNGNKRYGKELSEEDIINKIKNFKHGQHSRRC